MVEKYLRQRHTASSGGARFKATQGLQPTTLMVSIQCSLPGCMRGDPKAPEIYLYKFVYVVLHV